MNFGVIPRFSNDVDIGLPLEDPAERVTKLVVTIGDQNARQRRKCLLITPNVSAADVLPLLVGLVVLPGRCIGQP